MVGGNAIPGTGIATVIAGLQQYVGQPWATANQAIDAAIHGAGFVYRWIQPTDDVDLTEYRSDRINIMVGAATGNALTSNPVQSFTVG